MNPKCVVAVLDRFATATDVAKHAEATALCVAPHLLAAAPEGPRLTSVCGWPDGTHHPLIKATEARFAVQHGAVGITMVPNLGAIRAGDMNALLTEIVTVREAITEQVELTVVLEGADNLAQALDIAAKAGADRVQAGTSLSTPQEISRLLGPLPVTAVGVPGQEDELLAAGASLVLSLER